MLWDGLTESEGRGPSPRAGHAAVCPGPADRKAVMGGEHGPSISGACGFALGRWFGKEGL